MEERGQGHFSGAPISQTQQPVAGVEPGPSEPETSTDPYATALTIHKQRPFIHKQHPFIHNQHFYRQATPFYLKATPIYP